MGAGPAGCAAAITLRGLRVVMLEAAPGPSERIGENMASSANRLLGELGVAPAFLTDGHLPCHARVSRWGSEFEESTDALLDLDGPGWLLDRARFDARLREAAQDSGARLIAPARATSRSFDGERWWITHTGAQQPIGAAFVIDATGRDGRTPARARHDRLLCAWTHLPRDRTSPSLTQVQSAPDGWWYTAPLPGGRRVLAFHTDPDIAKSMDLRATLLARAAEQNGIAQVLGDSDLSTPGTVAFCAAGSRAPVADESPGALKVGDASMAFDPLSGQGIFHALYTGTMAARAVHASMAGDAEAVRRYRSGLMEVWRTYQSRWVAGYAAERRWADRPFWRRRHAAVSV